jgi:hypothetical protein
LFGLTVISLVTEPVLPLLVILGSLLDDELVVLVDVAPDVVLVVVTDGVGPPVTVSPEPLTWAYDTPAVASRRRPASAVFLMEGSSLLATPRRLVLGCQFFTE